MAIVDDYVLKPMIGDPDDHRPHTHWAALTDPAGIVESLAAIVEEIAPGAVTRSTCIPSTSSCCIGVVR